MRISDWSSDVCSSDLCLCPGGHWNPTGHKHGKDNPAGMHMGDMPNMIAGADGAGEMEYVIPGGTVSSGTTPLLDGDGMTYRSEEHTSELQSLMRISYAVFCLKKKKNHEQAEHIKDNPRMNLSQQ